MTTANPVIPGSYALITPEELLLIPDGVSFELVQGKLVERNMGMESSEIAARILILLGMFLRDKRLGRLFGADASYQCFPDPDKVRKPDVSFIRSERLPGDRVLKGHCPIHPDLAVEVISPGDLAYEVEEKVAEYLAAGVPLVWGGQPPYPNGPHPPAAVVAARHRRRAVGGRHDHRRGCASRLLMCRAGLFRVRLERPPAELPAFPAFPPPARP